MMINALCFDVEPWYTAELVKQYLPKTNDSSSMQEAGDKQVVESVATLLDLLDKHNVKATFAMVGILADRHPELVRTIHEKGHEIASHSYSHTRLHDLGEKKFEEEIKECVAQLESITGEKPVGFRAPTASVDNSTKWAFGILKKHGFKYDSSIFPMRTMLYGISGAPLHPYKPSMDDITKESPDGEIIEFPNTVLKLGVNIPIAGGFYFRFLPFWFLKFAINKVNKTRPGLLYIHPWETISRTPRLKNMSIFTKFVTYYGINSSLLKLERLLAEFEFAPIRTVLSEYFQVEM